MCLAEFYVILICNITDAMDPGVPFICYKGKLKRSTVIKVHVHNTVSCFPAKPDGLLDLCFCMIRSVKINVC